MTTKLTIRILKREIKYLRRNPTTFVKDWAANNNQRNKLKMMLLELKTRRYKMLEKAGYYRSEPKAGWEVRESKRGERYRRRVYD